MDNRTTSRLTGGFLACLLTLAGSGSAWSESLAGSRGDQRYPVSRVNVQGGCTKAFDTYVASPYHAAYAQTPTGTTGNYFCGSSLRAKSKAAAEKAALASCESVGKKYKLPVAGKCKVYASK